MANPTGNNAAAGDFARTAGMEVISRKSDSTGCAKGDVVHFSTDGLTIVGTTSGNLDDGYAVALEAVAANADGRFAVGNSYVYVTADGAIKPYNLVKIAGTAGQIVALDRPGDSALNLTVANTTNMEADLDTAIDAQRDYIDKLVGRYIAHQLEEVGDPTDAANDDIVIVRLGL